VPRWWNHTVADHEFELQRVVNQGTFNSGYSLIQTGLYRSGNSIQLDTCPLSVNEYTYFMEYKVAGSNSYNCANYGVAPTLQTDYFTTYAWPNAGSGEWAFGMNNGSGGGYFSGENIGSTTAIPMIGEELNNNVGTQCQASSSSVAGFYAYPYPNLTDDWYVYFAPNAGSPAPIVNPANTVLLYATNTNLWSIPNVPFDQTTISHTGSTTCDTNHGNG
jgi:hypothetical protein